MYSVLIEAIKAYLSNKLSLHDLENFVVSRLQDILDSSEQRPIDLVNEVDALLIERGENVISDEGFREQVSRLATPQGELLVMDSTHTSNQSQDTHELTSLTARWIGGPLTALEVSR